MRKIFKDYDTKYIITIPALVPKVFAAKADLDNIQVLLEVISLLHLSLKVTKQANRSKLPQAWKQ